VVPVAGFSGTSYAEFLRYDSGGIFLWATTMIAIGYGAGEWIENYTNSVKFPNGLLLTLVVATVVCLYGIKLWRLKKFGRAELVEAQ
jgi:membrane protein DedA with SNARE-associated domain